MPKDTMTSKERWLCVLNGEKPDRIPMYYSAVDEATEKLAKHLGAEDEMAICDQLHIDKCITVEPEYAGPSLPENTTVFGTRYEDIHYDGGVYTEISAPMYDQPLAKYKTVEEIEKNYQWPSPDWWDYSSVADQIAGKEDCIIGLIGSEPFMDYKQQLRGPEQAYMDLIENPEIVHYCLDKLFDLCYEKTRRVYEAIPGKVMLTWVAEDLGSQVSLLYSPAHIREFFIPRMKRMMELVHQTGAYVFFHSDGAIRKIIPDMIEAGIDVLNPIQWNCTGMEREALVRDFGDKVVFHGGVDNQYTLAFGSPEEVRQEIAENIRIFSKGRGYILAPCHNIQVVSPPENVVAMYEAGYENGWIR